MTIQDYLESTTAVQLNRFTGCRIESTEGEEVLTIQFIRTPTQAELENEVRKMIRETGIPEQLTDAIIRQVKTCVTFTMKVA